jgi:Glycosyl hydrolases family 43
LESTCSLPRACSFGLRRARSVGFVAAFVAVSPFLVASSARAANANATPPVSTIEGASTSLPAPVPSSPNAAGQQSLPPAPGGVAAGSVSVWMPTPSGPQLIAIDFPDPFVFHPSASGSLWYGYATGSGFVDLQMISSPDLVNWSWVGDPLPGAANNWADLFGFSWAPSVIERPGNSSGQRFVMYYTAHDRASGLQCIGRATSASPAGPFSDERTSPLICQTANGGSIDPNPFVAADGTLWLVFSNTTSIWSVRLTSDGLSVASGARKLLSTASGTWEGPVIEGPTMISSPSGVELFYSANVWETSAYAVGVARCNGPTGPCSRIYSTAVLATRSPMAGPGGQTPFQDTTGNWQVAFDAWTSPNIGYPSGGARTLRFLPLTFPSGLPKIG